MGVSVVTLTCPVCGAPFSPRDENCSYCGSILVLRTDHPKINPASLNKHVIDERISEFRNDLRVDPHNSAAHYGLGVAYFNLRLTDDSVRELEEAARLMPENPNIQSQLAVVLKQAADEGRPGAQGKLKDRIEYTLRLDPENFDALLLKAENDVTLGGDKRIEILERLYRIDEKRAGHRLCGLLMEIAQSEKVRDTPKEIELLRRAHELDGDRADEALANALGRKAVNLSKSDPYADTVDPTRSRQALRAWHDLSAFNPTYAKKKLTDFLSSLHDLSKSDARNLRRVTAASKGGAPRTFQGQQIIDQVATTTETATNSIIKPIIIGVLKGIGLFIASFIIFGIVSSLLSEDHFLSVILALLVVLSLFVAPIGMSVKEVKNARRAMRSGVRPLGSQPEALQTQRPTTHDRQFIELLSILRSYFLNRWDREIVDRIRMDRTNGGSRAERQRTKQFRGSLTTD